MEISAIRYSELLAAEEERDRLAEAAVHQVNALEACAKLHHAGCLLGAQIRGAIGMAQIQHTPRRPLSERLEREAEIVGAVLDGQSLEQGEVL